MLNIDLSKLSQLMHRENWSEKQFSFKKAAICATFSELAYCVAESAKKNKMNRLNLIPYSEYKYTNIDITDLEAEFIQNEIGELFVIETKYAIVVGSLNPKVIIISIRGTIDAYDWSVNLNCFKTRHKNYAGQIEKYHKGFYKAIVDCLKPIEKKIQAYHKKKAIAGYNAIPIIVTGHSLGGAMAAIYKKIGEVKIPATYLYDMCGNYAVKPTCAYTFGMPRFGDRFAVHNNYIYHIYKEKDIVPTIPPQWMGFANPRNEFSCDGEEIENISQRDTLSFLIWTSNLLRNVLHKFHDHEISGYRRSIEFFNSLKS